MYSCMYGHMCRRYGCVYVCMCVCVCVCVCVGIYDYVLLYGCMYCCMCGCMLKVPRTTEQYTVLTTLLFLV